MLEAGDLSGDFTAISSDCWRVEYLFERWVWQQYDHMVQTNTWKLPAPAMPEFIRSRARTEAWRWPRRQRALVLSRSARWARCTRMAEAARKVALRARPQWRYELPELRPIREGSHHVAVFAGHDGITKACEELEIPITGGKRQLLQRNSGRGDLSDAGAWSRRHSRRCPLKRRRSLCSGWTQDCPAAQRRLR